MTLSVDTLEWLKSETADIEIVEKNGELYSNRNLFKVRKPLREPIFVTTLTGLVDYIKSGFDGNERFIVTIDDCKSVTVQTKLNNNKSREHVVVAKAQLPNIVLSEFMDLECFNIQLQSVFVPSEQKSTVLSLIGNIKSEAVKNTGDNGITQSVEVRQGIATVATADVPNPVELKPYRTFTEITQPESAFVLRLREGVRHDIEAGLFEADGGAWKNEAIQSIKAYLAEQLKDVADRVTILA